MCTALFLIAPITNFSTPCGAFVCSTVDPVFFLFSLFLCRLSRPVSVSRPCVDVSWMAVYYWFLVVKLVACHRRASSLFRLLRIRCVLHFLSLRRSVVLQHHVGRLCVARMILSFVTCLFSCVVFHIPFPSRALRRRLMVVSYWFLVVKLVACHRRVSSILRLLRTRCALHFFTLHCADH